MQAYLSGFALSIFIKLSSMIDKIKWNFENNLLLGQIVNPPIMIQNYPSFYLRIQSKNFFIFNICSTKRGRQSADHNHLSQIPSPHLNFLLLLFLPNGQFLARLWNKIIQHWISWSSLMIFFSSFAAYGIIDKNCWTEISQKIFFLIK